MLLRIVCAGSIFWTAVSCRTPEESSNVKDSTPGASGQTYQPVAAMKLLVSLENEAAQGMYDALNAEEQTDQTGGRKSYQGDVSVFCERSGSGGQIPPGAQGIVAPASYSCGIFPTTGAGFPDGAQGMPAAPVLSLDGDTARAFHIAFKVQEFPSGGSGRKNFQGNVDISCQYTDQAGTRTAYNCQVRGAGKDGDTTNPATDLPLLTLTGNDAKLVYDKLKIAAVSNVKQRTGDTVINCEQHGFGSQIPPGAQGIAAAATFKCQFVAPASIPDGAQGFPGPGKVLAKLDGALAKSVFKSLTLEEQSTANGILKEFNGEATIRCAFVKVNGKKKHDCLVKQGGAGGPPPGAQGLPQPH